MSLSSARADVEAPWAGRGAEPRLFELFHVNTKYTAANLPAQALEIARHLRSRDAVEAASRNFKRYRFVRRRTLACGRPPDMPLGDALRLRVSTRRFAPSALSLETLGAVLIPAAGCNRTAIPAEFPDLRLRLRSYPSGGGEYPLEIYPVLLRVAGLEPCVTHYSPLDDALSFVREGVDVRTIAQALVDASAVLEAAAALLVVTAVFARSTVKYGDRGYRMVLLEAGHLAQNLCLTAAAAGCGSLAWGGFYDDRLNGLIGVDGLNEAVVHSLFIGVPAREAD